MQSKSSPVYIYIYGLDGDIDRGGKKTTQFRQICILTRLGDRQSIFLLVW